MDAVTILLAIAILVISIWMVRTSIIHQREDMQKPIVEDHGIITDLIPVDIEFSNAMEVCIDTEEEGMLEFFVDINEVPLLRKGEKGILKHQGHIFVDFIEAA